MPIKNGRLTQPKYSEEWVVEIGDKGYVLNQDEIKILKEASKSGFRGIVWFDKFAISIPHIQSIYRARKWRQIDYEHQLQRGRENFLSKDEVHKRITEIRNRFKNRM